MISFLQGDIVDITLSTINIEVNGIGFEVQVSRPQDFSYGRALVYTYFQVKDDMFCLYGFKTKQEKDLFLRLIDVNGIGPKTASAMLGATTVANLISAIEFGNISFLKKLPSIGAKAAQQIVLDLKGKLVVEEKKVDFKKDDTYNDVYDALRQFGYKTAEIDSALNKVENISSKNITTIIKECLSMLRK